MNILVVDDEEILQDVLGLLLRKEGFRPIAARTGASISRSAIIPMRASRVS